VAYPFVYRKIVKDQPTQGRIFAGAFAASIVGLQLGALAVVVQTVISGVSALPFDSFLLLMQPIHLAIGVIEGIATFAVILFIWKARPEVLAHNGAFGSMKEVNLTRVLIGLLAVTVLTAGALSWFASTDPDGLEWAFLRSSGREEPPDGKSDLHVALADLQEKTAFLPDYALDEAERPGGPEKASEDSATVENASGEDDDSTNGDAWPAVRGETSLAGIVGGALCLLLAGLIGLGLKMFRGRLD
jgi:cobalt/nickel transport system permease protein